MPVLRPLPDQPSLEHDRKSAKSLLRSIRAGDAEALARAREWHEGIRSRTADHLTLSDAQLVVAREYGFASWPRLVHYMHGIERIRHCARQSHLAPEFQHSEVRSLLAGHRDRRPMSGRALAAYVPKCYGLSVQETFSREITEDEARLAVARRNGCVSWTALLERAEESRRARSQSEWELTPLQRAARAMKDANLVTLQQVVHEHPELLRPTAGNRATGGVLVYAAIHGERTNGRDAMRPIMEWLAVHGQDRQRALNEQLCNHPFISLAEARDLLDAGADPNWIAPNGVSVLEHALLRFDSVAVVDLIAARTVPRKALWIAAGLGDVGGVRHFLDRHGKPTRAAYRHRPPFDAASPFGVPQLPEPDAEEMLFEAFWVAVINQRVAVIEYMASRGFDVNCALWGGMPIVNMAVGNAWTAVVECLVRLGADLDVHEGNSNGTARDLARTMWLSGSYGLKYRRIAELCGLDADALAAEREATPAPTPSIAPKMRSALDLASDDAARHSQTDVRAENLLFGLLRAGGLPLLYFTQVSEMDRERFLAETRERLLVGAEPVKHDPLPLHADAQALLDAAVGYARARRRDAVDGLHLLRALMDVEAGAATALLARYGGDVARLNEQLRRAH